MREVIWLAGADADLQAIFALLEERQPGHGVRFMDEINAELAWLREYPEGRPKKPAPFRKQRIVDSPFALFYTNEARGILVHAILDRVRNRARFFAAYSDAIPITRVDERPAAQPPQHPYLKGFTTRTPP